MSVLLTALGLHMNDNKVLEPQIANVSLARSSFKSQSPLTMNEFTEEVATTFLLIS